MMRKSFGCATVLGSILVAACSGGSGAEIGSSNKGLLSARDVQPPRGECTEGKTPNVCCQGERCYMWLDDPFRPCEFGYTAIADGSRCCSPKAKTCEDPKPRPTNPRPTTPPYPLPPTEPEPPPSCSFAPTTITNCAADMGYRVSTNRGPAGSPEVHVIGVYETHSGHSYMNHPRGRATVRVERKGHHILVLSSYEPVDYELTVAPGSVVDTVILNGLHPHTVLAPAGTQVIDRSGSAGFLSACSYVYPGDDQGCDTGGLLRGVEKLTGRPVTSFAGCYHASDFVLRDDPKECTDPTPTPPPPPPSDSWEAHAFSYDRAQSDCAGGARYVRYEPRYARWVGVELCSATRYKIFLGESRGGVFHEIGDFAGHGQDHCELVNPRFTIPNEDDETSGCPSCAVEMAGWARPGPVPVYSRHRFGEPFVLQTWPEHNLYTSRWYECGVSIP